MAALDGGSSVRSGGLGGRPASGQAVQGQNMGSKGTVAPVGGAQGSSHGGGYGGLKEGQVFHGGITNITAKEMTIRLDNGQRITARYENGLELSIGDETNFKVTSAGPGSSTYIKAVGNTSVPPQDITIQKALDAAGLPMTERNAELVNSLLRNHMPINKQTIASMLQQSYLNKGISMNTLVVMTKYHFPITAENAEWFERYANQEHQILSGMENIAEELENITRLSFSADGTETSNDFNMKIFNLLRDGILSNTEDGGHNTSALLLQGGGNAVDNLLADDVFLPDRPAGDMITATDATAVPFQDGVLSQLFRPEECIRFLHLFPEDTLDSNTAQSILYGDLPLEKAAELVLEFLPDPDSTDQDLLTRLLSPEAGKDTAADPAASAQPGLGAMLSSFLGTAQVSSFEQGTLPLTEFFQALGRGLQQLPERQQAALFTSPEYQGLLRGLLSANWTLRPDTLAKDGSVRELYDRIYSQLGQMTDAARELPGSARLASTLNTLKENINFMNTLNELYTYVQVPLRLNGRDVHSELFVYTNKKNLQKNGGNLSVLLHLDLTRLGSLDVRIQLSGSEVTTKFYVDDEQSASLIEQHVSELDTALIKKGYHNTHEVIKKEVEIHFLNDFIEMDSPSSDPKRYSFDVRA